MKVIYDPGVMGFIIGCQALSKSGESFPDLLMKGLKHNCKLLLECKSSAMSAICCGIESK